jgi:hypothetical protein
MSDYFQGKHCIVDFREIAFMDLRDDGATVQIVLKGSGLYDLHPEDGQPFLEAYRQWIEKQPERKGCAVHQYVSIGGEAICRVCGRRPIG